MTEERYMREMKQAWIMFGFGLYQLISMMAATFFTGWVVLLWVGLGFMILGMVRGAYLEVMRARGGVS